jgi:hypothetical protein
MAWPDVTVNSLGRAIAARFFHLPRTSRGIASCATSGSVGYRYIIGVHSEALQLDDTRRRSLAL